ncbi:MAG: hypothetical protein ACI3VN_02620 [Candidatus Onthomonas sp.]
MVRIKQRAPYYCNLKLQLLFMVVWGHLVEDELSSIPLLETIYRLVYLVHMPLFVFLTGFFLKNRDQCLSQLRRAALLYLAAQSAAAAVEIWMGEAISLLIPVWHLWYLLSLVWWAGLAWLLLGLLERFPALRTPVGKGGVILLSAAMSLLSGCWAGRFLSLGRTLAFLPWLVLGLLCPREIDWGRHRILGLGGLVLALELFLWTGGRYRRLFSTGLTLMAVERGRSSGCCAVSWRWDWVCFC